MREGEAWAIDGFADLWLWSDRESTAVPRQRDYREAVVAAYACETCGAHAGEYCTRWTVSGRIHKRMPHLGRGKPGRNDPRRPKE